jgi:DNA polymerase-3 subunit epsilon
LLKETLVVLDFETSGLSPGHGDRITEVAVVRIQDNRVVDRFDSLVNCGVRLTPYIIGYTGITQRMVDSAPPARAVIEQLIRFVGSSCVVAHNAGFDQRFFESECDRSGFRSIAGPFLCSLLLSRRIFPQYRSHALGNITSQLGIQFPGAAHRAASDAAVTASLVLRIAAEMQRSHAHLTIDSSLLRKVMKMPVATTQEKLARLALRRVA